MAAIVIDNALEYTSKILGRLNIAVKTAYSLSFARNILKNIDEHCIIIANSHLSDEESVDLLEWMRSNGKTHPFMIVTNRPEIHTAFKAMKLETTDYILMQYCRNSFGSYNTKTRNTPTIPSPQGQAKHFRKYIIVFVW